MKKLLALILSLGVVAIADGSDLVSYQGKLTDAASAPLPNGQYRIGIRIWDTVSGGTVPLWARKYDVPVQAGLFSVMIGSTGVPWEDPAPLTASLKLALSGTSRFIEITVMSDAGQPEKPAGEWKVLSPRQSLGAVPYAMNGVPPGTVVPFAGTVVPDGWAICDGTTLYDGADPRYAPLFGVIGTTYGAGTGSQFRLPDLRGRVPAGRDNMGGTSGERLTNSGTGAPNFSTATTNLGAVGGADRITLQPGQMAQHSHGPGTYSISGGSHSHGGAFLRKGTGHGGGAGLAFYNVSTSGNAYFYIRSASGETGANAAPVHVPESTHTHPSNEWSGSSAVNTPNGEAHPNTQPTIILNYIIKL